MEAINTIEQALERAIVSGQAAEKAIEARDSKQAPALVYETLHMTLEALALCARAGQLNSLQNLLPNAVYYVRVLNAFDKSPFDEIEKISIGSSVGAEQE